MDNDFDWNISAKENSKEYSTQEPVRQRKKAFKNDKHNKRSNRKSRHHQCDNLLIQRAEIKLSHDLEPKLNSNILAVLSRSLTTTRQLAAPFLRRI
jgi:hypothetical protein